MLITLSKIISSPKPYIIKSMHDSLYRLPISKIKYNYGNYYKEYEYDFIKMNFQDQVEDATKEWQNYKKEINTIIYEHENINIYGTSGIFIVKGKYPEYVYLKNSFARIYNDMEVYCINLESMQNRYKENYLKYNFGI